MNNLNYCRRLAASSFAAGLLLACSGSALAAVHYVDVNSTNATAPYTNWATASANIQDAVDVAAAGDQIVVTNGIYATGGRSLFGTMTNRVAVDKPLVLRSVNGPQCTVIQGSQVPGTTNGDGAIRCVALTDGCVLAGFTLTNGATRALSDIPPYPQSSGGALWCASTNGIVVSDCVIAGSSAYFLGAGAFQGTLTNCTLSGNSSSSYGGGAYQSRLNNCTLNGNAAILGGGAAECLLNNCAINGNSASSESGGGGAYDSTLNNCTLTGNWGGTGGGAANCRLNNCTLTGNSAYQFGGGCSSSVANNSIVYFNTAPNGENFDSHGFTTLNYCCTTPQPTNGVGNISLDPQLASTSHLSALSPCRGTGNAAYATGTDIDGEAWANPPSMGCDEYHIGALTAPLSVGIVTAFTNVPSGYLVALTAMIQGPATASVWDFGDGTMATNQPYASHAWTTLADYTVVLRAYNDSLPAGMSATVTVHVVTQPVHYVAADSASPVAPYTSWATAATNIQDAVDAATMPGALVLVTNGTYASGGRAVFGTMTNRVAVDKPLILRSVNGPQFSVIQGYEVPGTTLGDGAVRCVYIARGARMSGFTLTHGATRSVGFATTELSGGGLWCEPAAVVSNCVMIGNSAQGNGGGAYQGTLHNCTMSENAAGSGGGASGCILKNCTLTGNSASYGGGANGSTLHNCTLTGNSADNGGGVSEGTLDNCSLSLNSASGSGGGAWNSTINNCALGGNTAHESGGGVYYGNLNNCTLTGNSAGIYGGGAAGGVFTLLNNCVVYFNTAPQGANYDSSSLLNYCCTTPTPSSGTGNISVDPQLLSSSHLSSASPCRGAGLAAAATGTDIDGEAWARPPSIGCDEYNAGPLTGPLSVNAMAGLTNVTIGFAVQLTALIEGQLAASTWDFGDGTMATNQIYTSHAWKALGDYTVVLRAYNESQPGGISATAIVHVIAPPVHYVSSASDHPVAPYTSWATAATSIQDAVDAATVPGALVLVTNGSYAALTVHSHLAVSSVNGALVTMIDGGGSSRCVTLAGDASLSGFTMTRGFSNLGGGANGGTCNDCTLLRNSATYGGGAYQSTLNNCTLTGNSATSSGGGADSCRLNNCTLSTNSNSYGGGGANESTLNNCTLSGNSAGSFGGGAWACSLTNCTLSGNSAGDGGGGGAYQGTLKNCTLIGNSTFGYGGGAYQSALANCTLMGNSAGNGGGAYSSTLNGCALARNSATNSGGGACNDTLNNCTVTGNSALNVGGGVSGGTLNNCIVYFNSAPYGANYDSAGTLNYCCTTPLPAGGTGNTSSPPELASLSHLSTGSPCRGAGSAASASGTDIDGEAWLNPPSIGCDEYHPDAVTGPLIVGITAPFTTVAIGFATPLTALIDGRTTESVWDFGDGVAATNQPLTSHVWTVPGDYSVGLRAYNDSQPGGITATLVVHVVVRPTHYVAADGVNPVAPYLSWATAARNIQDAVDAVAIPGAVVLVTNGTYATGGRAVYGTMTNRVAVYKPLGLRSVNGPQFTIIKGHQLPDGSPGVGDGAVRCVYLTNGASLAGFTLINGATRNVFDSPPNRESSGGALWCESTNAVIVSNCVLVGNSAALGGCAYQGTLNYCSLSNNPTVAAYACTLNNCALSDNPGGGANACLLNNCALTGNAFGTTASTLNNCELTGNSGAGAYSSTLKSCFLSGNLGGGTSGCMLNNCILSGNAGGASSSRLNNCIVYFNSSAAGVTLNYDSSCSLNYCCTTPLPTNGVGNISLDPQLANASHLGADSPCRGAGNAADASGLDIDGELWGSPPSIGCDEYHAGGVTGPLSVGITASFTNVAPGFVVQLTAFIQGRATASTWDFGDGATATNQPYTSHAWAALGEYTVVLRAYNDGLPSGISTTVTVHVVNEVHYVAADGANPVAPYTTWGTAATNIQDAVDAATVPGALVLVTNGIYTTGGRPANFSTTNRVAVDKLLALRSVNGPGFTVIDGGHSVRCVYLTNGASVSGFTLTNGLGDYGGGIFCESANSVVSNCVLSGNSAYGYYGGGAYDGTLNDCVLTGNSASGVGGGAVYSTLIHCALMGNSANQLGGGAQSCTLNDCSLTSNSAAYDGGGAYNCTLNNCRLTNNSASRYGGGVNFSLLANCSLVSNSANDSGGGAYQCTLDHCTLTANSASNFGGGAYSSLLQDCFVSGNSARNGGGSYSNTLNNCTLTGNWAIDGGGASQSALKNCALTGNWATNNGGGAFQGTLSNCTLTGNSAINSGGGSSASSLNNCIIYYNHGGTGPNYDSSSTLNYCSTTPSPPKGIGNITSNPQLASAAHLSAASPCRGAGNADYASGRDIDGEPWADPPSIGCDEYHADALSGPLSVGISAAFTNVAVGYATPLIGLMGGRITASIWDFDDGTTATNQPYTSHAWAAAGEYAVVLHAFNENHPIGVSTVIIIHVVAQPIHYVSQLNTRPVAPYTSWETAARKIQDAVDAATIPGALVLVANGIYAVGGRATLGDSTPNRLVVDKPLNIRSVNGPRATIVDGSRSNRCVYLTSGAILSGFTLTNGVGGGAKGGTVTNCFLSGNSGGAYSSTLYNCTLSSNDSGGAYDSTLNNCALTGNSGAGAYFSALNNCTLSGNSGGGAYSCTLNNCIVFFNTPAGANYDSSSTLNYCCTTPLPTNGIGNISLDPQLASSSHLSSNSPCRGAGNVGYVSGTDIDGEAWTGPPSMGCDEYNAGNVMGGLITGISATFTNVAVGFEVNFTALIQGRTTGSRWAFGDGLVEANQPYTSHAWAAPGDYVVALWAFNERYPAGIRAAVIVHVVTGVHYVAADSRTPMAPYTSWATAATSIQAAIAAAVEPGAQVRVTNGVYEPVNAQGPLTVRSVNGPRFTVISGGRGVRCAYVAGGAQLSGFTLRDGRAEQGAGVLCGSTNAVVSNCVLTGNIADQGNGGVGGGASGGTLNNCLLTGNSALGHTHSVQFWCATGFGGGGQWCTFHYFYPGVGGGAFGCILNNCTVTGNSAGRGGGVSGCTLNNCIVMGGAEGGSQNHCWTTDPLFVNEAAGNLRLQPNSPCVDAGDNTFAVGSTDLDGRPRILDGTIDMGAYEFQPSVGGAFIGWLEQYGLPTDGSADSSDSDGDGVDNYNEWLVNSDPTNRFSFAPLLSLIPSGPNVILTWPTNAFGFTLQSATNLVSPVAWVTNSATPGIIGGQNRVTNSITGSQQFYRLVH